jgi:plastocyanin
MKLNHWLGLAAAAASALSVSAADITGKITLKGTPTPEKELPLDPACGNLHAEGKPKTRFYAVGAGGELADTVVYLKDAGGKTFPVPAEGHLIDQKGCEYVPYVSAAQAGQKILVRNSDPVMHNVHPQPTVAGNTEKNVAQMPKSKDLEFTYPNPEPFLKFKCDIHPWMFSYVSTFPHPYYAVSAKDGTFTIKNVPKGEYTVEAAHRKAGKAEQKVTVGDANATVNLTLNVPAQ